MLLFKLLICLTACATAVSTALFPTEQVAVDERELNVWVADDSAERQRGLMEVEELPGGIDGMLFVFEEPGPRSFHMRDTPMELDIWWFDQNMMLVEMAEMEPCPQEPCTSYASPGDVRWVLETPRDAYEFEVGETLAIVDSD